MAFDENRYKAIFEKRFGSGSFDAGLSQAQQIGSSTAQAEYAKKLYDKRRSEAESAAKKAQKEAEKEAKKVTYEDAYSYWSNPENKKAAKEKGAYRTAQDIRNDPRKKEQIKAAGYNLNQFIDALYESASDGKFRSEREYNEYSKKVQKEAKAESSSSDVYSKYGITKESTSGVDKLKTLKKKDEPKGNSFLKDIGAGFKAAGQAMNPFDDVSMSDAVMNFANRNKSKGFQELQRGSNRAVDSASLGALSAIDRKMTGDTPYYQTQRKLSEGGIADIATSGLGYLVPGVGAYKALGVTKAGKGIEALAKGGVKQRVASEAAKGAITGAGVAGAEVGIREAITPEVNTASDNLKHLALGTAAGAIADPLLYGAGQGALRGLSKFAKGDVPTFTGKVSEGTLNKLKTVEAPKNPTEPNFDRLMQLNRAETEAPTPSLTPIRRESLQTSRAFEPIESLKGNGGSLKMGTPIDRTPIDINNPKEIVKRQIDTSGNKEKTKWSFDKAYTAIMDDLHPLNKATKELGGKDLPFEKNPYTQARLARGVAGKAETYLKGGVYTEDGQKVGASLQEIIKPIEKNMDDFLAYVTSKRALDYDEKGLIAGIKPKDVEGMSDRQLADATIRQIEAESPEFATRQQELVNYSRNLMNELKESGYYTEDTLKAIFEENPNYVPMNRVQPPKVRGFEPLTNPKNKFASLADPIKKRTGSEKPIVNPIESIVKNTYIINNIAERNKVGVSLLNMLESAPEENAWGRVVNVSKQDDSIDSLSSILDEASSQIDSGKSDALDNLFKGEGNKVYVYRDGQKVEMELQEDLYKAMLSLDTQKQNFLIKVLAAPARTLRAGAVLSPDFGPVNIFRDQFSAYINSKYGFKPFVDMFSGLANVLKKDDVYWQWKNNGGANSVLSSLDREYLQGDLRKLIKETSKQRISRNLSNPKMIPLKFLDKAIEPLRIASEITEEATRLGEFKKGLKKGASPKEAAFASRDLIDFNRAGNIGRQYNQITAFFNAAVQSMDKTVRTFKEDSAGATVRAFMGITLPSIVAYVYNSDKDWYKEIPQRERDLYWHFEIGDQIYKLPKPFEVGVLFGTSAERTLEFLKTNDPEAYKGFGETVANAFTPPWLPTALAPLAEVYANKSMYFDSPIVPRREEGLLPEDQFGPYQSELSKGLGKLTKTSPRKLEHVFKGYTGGLGKYFLQMTDSVAEVSGTERPELPDRGMADMPIVNRFVVKNLEGNNQSVNDFYKNLDKLKRENLSAQKNKVENPDAAVYKEFNKLSRDISELQKEKRNIIDDSNMSGKDKADIIKKIDLVITRIAKQGNSLK